MTPTWFLGVVLALGAMAKGSRVIVFQLVMCLFGATAALELSALGGAPVVPAVAFLPFLLVRAWSERTHSSPLRIPPAGIALLVTVGWGLISAVVLPRLLAGSVAVRTYDRATTADAMTVLLRPVSGNITQSAYATLDVLVFLAMRSLLVRRGRAETFARGVLWLATANCAAAVLGLAEFYAGFPKLLALVRNANYTVYDTYELGGVARVQGTFPEAAVFSMFTLPLFAFALHLWLRRTFAPASGYLTLATLFLLLISTSGTAYVGLGIYLVLVTIGLAARLLVRGEIPRFRPIFVAIALAGVLAGTVMIVWPERVSAVISFFDTTVGQKMTSSSGVDRSLSNRIAWGDFVETYGLGVGLGSGRASSFVLVLLSNLGIIGFVAFGVFLLDVVRSPGRDGSDVSIVAQASRQAVLAGLVAACLMQTVFELGIAFYCFAAAATIAPRDIEDPDEAMTTHATRWA